MAVEQILAAFLLLCSMSTFEPNSTTYNPLDSPVKAPSLGREAFGETEKMAKQTEVVPPKTPHPPTEPSRFPTEQRVIPHPMQIVAVSKSYLRIKRRYSNITAEKESSQTCKARQCQKRTMRSA